MTPIATAIFLSGFLFFLAQPLLGRVLLPWYGGSQAVWTTCLLFFQVMLAAGVGYAHLLGSKLKLRQQVYAHWGLTLLSLTALHLVPERPAAPAGSPGWQIFALLFTSFYLPGLLLASSAPLLLGWSRSEEVRTAPWRLFALFLGGAMLGLFGYVILLELTVRTELLARLWSAGYLVFAVMLVASGKELLPFPVATGEEPTPEAGPTVTRWKDWLAWIGLPACASVLLLTFTAQLTQDFAPGPRLWVVPLGVYLASLALCFGLPGAYRRRFWIPLFLVGLLWVAWRLNRENPPHLGLWGEVARYCGALFAACVVCHGEMVRRRPAEGRRTVFQLCVAGGGALGGFLVAVVAPLVFSGYWEMQAGMALTVLLVGVFLFDRSYWRRNTELAEWGQQLWIYGVTALILLLGLGIHTRLEKVTDATRSFYGVLAIKETGHGTDDHYARLLEGSVTAGGQYSQASRRLEALARFSSGSGVALAIARHPRRQERASDPNAPGLKIGVVGLGAGTVAAICREVDLVRIYEINPDALVMARRHFTYLSGAVAQVEPVPGEVLLSLEEEPPNHFDVLVLDTFSRAAFPSHLLTREAFELYWDHLKDDGILAVCVDNARFDLAPVVRGVADTFSKTTVKIPPGHDDTEGMGSGTWLLVTSNSGFLKDPLVRQKAGEFHDDRRLVWTDESYNVFDSLRQ